jgi:hydrogenase maturation protease
MSERLNVLLIGYGNPARGDDGLGPALADAVAAWHLPGVKVETAFQLAVEDAADVAEHDAVIFADASVSGPEPFVFEPVVATAEASFSSHSVEPGAVMTLARDLFKSGAHAYVLGIRGYDFEMFCEKLSDGAARNLAAALDFIGPILRERGGAGFNTESPASAGSLKGGPCETTNT